ncbi:MAG: hypothetical protein M3407_00840 [Acidobacteriota bacterium]|nr:hypothetical protein [Acidobacteriota bacterium]
MAVKNKKKRRLWHRPDNRKEKDDLTEIAAQLAPLEEIHESLNPTAHPNNNGGAIWLDTGALNLPKGLGEEDDARSSLWRPEPVILAILLIALAFIAFIAWQISLMPPVT